MQKTFELRGEYIALCDLLKICGVADSGGAAKHLVAEGGIAVDGQQELRKTCKIRPGSRVSGTGFAIDVVAAGD
ncbi:MAG: RNA-binding S4 domain-containing protein [Paludibacterium sp.]|uniref:RNA-binding S4 domain-containing protein n=1 Tax=Paludibacterium sp. TaxID=1917523 RepID=UPI0025FA9FD8|nr:RNA-binding S4 domain-containing protein [Paludibacterium sp.]MBV8047445.1 RNA-binding S4 domain-containing protein [Paludibacterium sp.]MBV8649210.1 RNA-binding S4 domain-containing protein [Paludibacterium sp.]